MPQDFLKNAVYISAIVTLTASTGFIGLLTYKLFRPTGFLGKDGAAQNTNKLVIAADNFIKKTQIQFDEHIFGESNFLENLNNMSISIQKSIKNFEEFTESFKGGLPKLMEELDKSEIGKEVIYTLMNIRVVVTEIIKILGPIPDIVDKNIKNLSSMLNKILSSAELSIFGTTKFKHNVNEIEKQIKNLNTNGNNYHVQEELFNMLQKELREFQEKYKKINQEK